jgi:hypothetical protein
MTGAPEKATRMSRAYLPSPPTMIATLAAFALALAAGAAARYGLVENTPLGHACEAGAESFACTVRFAVNEGFRTLVPGLVAVALGLWCLWRPGPLPLVLTALAAGLGLLLFNAWPSAFALTLALLTLARPARA